jgi:peptidoglycan hydrolase-like amidase
LFYLQTLAQQTVASGDMQPYFREAYKLYPNIPAGTLEATAYAASHLVNLQPHAGSDHNNCTGMPERFGIFALVEDGKGYFKNNLIAVCNLSNITPARFKSDVRLQILAVAKYLSRQAGVQKIAAVNAESFAPVLEKLSEIPEDGSAINTYARSLYTYDIYQHMQTGFSTPRFKAAPVKVQMDRIYPARTLRMLQSPNVRVTADQNSNDVSILSTDYPPALWDEAHTNNWGSRTNGQQPTNVTVHTMQGSYAGTISWFNNGNQVVNGTVVRTSAHYLVRSSDGQVTQMVREANRAFHVLNHNNYTIGIEHEGFVNDASWYTNAMYNSSATLVRDICADYNIDKTTCFKGAATSGTNFQPITVRIKGHQHYDGNTHTDPGINWNWTKYYGLINPAPPAAATTITFVVKNQTTGIGIGSAAVSVKRPNGTTSSLQTDASGKLVFGADSGRYEFAFTKSGYNKLETFFVGGEETAIAVDVNLDPATTALTAAETAAATLKAVGSKMILAGYVRDADANTPLAGVQVSAGSYSAVSDKNGFFSFAYGGAIPAITQGKTPAKIAIRAAKTGYVTHTIRDFYLIPETYTLKIALRSSSSPNARILQTEELEHSRHGMFDRTDAEEQQRGADAKAAAPGAPLAAVPAAVPITMPAAAAIAVPASIRVGTSCTCTTCSSVQVMSLEAYVQTGVDDEWISSWGAASLQAGTVAYRSYGAYYVAHPVKSNYDIASTTCNQAWEPDQATSVKNAAIATAGVVLTKSGAIFRSEYSAENNNSGCGDGFSGTGSTWPCISDSRCAGRTKNGHGRGMCQWGSSYWASDKTYQWILDHYYTPGGVSVQDPTAPAPTTITFTVKDQSTGNAIATASVAVTAPNGTTASLQTDASGKLVFGAGIGKYTFAFSKSGYSQLTTSFTGGGADSLITANIHLDPSATLAANVAAIPAAAGKTAISGYVSSADRHAPLSGVQVSAGMYTGVTDSKGFFSIPLPVPSKALVAESTPETIVIRFTKAGYVPHNIRHFYLVPGAHTVKVALTGSGNVGASGLQQAGEEVELRRHGLFDGTGADKQQHADAGPAVAGAAASPVAIAAVAVPASIRVSTSCACTVCEDPVVEVMSLESYVATGVDDEWISSWGAASLQAGAVAYRSVGAWYVQNPAAANYDISSAACHQTWQPDNSASVKAAATATKGVVLTKDGAIFKAEYSAENNNAGCGDGFSGNGSSWPCIADDRCKGRTKNGDGVGMCQWGSSFWASDKTYQWILNHYYNPGGVDSAAIAVSRTYFAESSVPGPEQNTVHGLQIAPNPVTGSEVKLTYTLTQKAHNAIILLSDNTGRPVLQQRVALQQGLNQLTLQTGALKGGIYIVTLQLAGGVSESKKLVLVK